MQSSSIGLSWAFLLLFIAAVITVALLTRGRRRRLPTPPRPRHWIARLVCGVLGVGLLAAVAIGTAVDFRALYAAAAPGPAVTVRVPANPAPESTMRADVGIYPVAGPMRLLVNLVVVDDLDNAPHPVRSATFEVQWPADRNRDFRHVFELGDDRQEMSLRIESVNTARPGEDAPVRLDVQGRSEIERWTGRNRYSTGQGFSGASSKLVLGGGTPRAPIGPFTILSRPERALTSWCFFSSAAEGDPLKTVPAEELLASRAGEMERFGTEAPDESRGMAWSALDNPIPARGLMLVAQAGVSSLTFVVAAILLAQVFTHRTLALVGMLAAAVLYVAALDRVVLGANLSRLEDKSASIPARRIACAEATGTFFFAKTAAGRIDKVAGDPATPGGLREFAIEARRTLARRTFNLEPHVVRNVMAEARCRVFDVPEALAGSVVAQGRLERIYGSDYSVAALAPAQVARLVGSMEAKPGMRIDQRRPVSWWPRVADSWSYSSAEDSGSGAGFLGVRAVDGVREIRIEYRIFNYAEGGHPTQSRIFYEGPAPDAGAISFLAPLDEGKAGRRMRVILVETSDWR